MKILCSIAAFLLLFSCNSTNSGNKGDLQRITSGIPDFSNTQAILPVHVLSTSDGIMDDSEVQEFKYPVNDTVDGVESFKDQIAAYGARLPIMGWPGRLDREWRVWGGR